MSLSPTSLHRIIERESLLGFTMAQPEFPCFAWGSESPVNGKDVLARFLEARPNSNWVLIGQGCIQAESQLWTAWNSASRRWLRSSALARSLDAEFLRYLTGTHHVSEAFKRAGVRDKDTSGFLLHLPNASSADDAYSDCLPVELDYSDSESQALSILSQLGLQTASMEFSLSREGASRLGMKFDSELEAVTEASLIGHIVSAEFTS
jgi:hypothetical protein